MTNNALEGQNKQTESNDSDEDDEYTRMLRHARKCKVKTRQLVDFRTHDRRKVMVNDKKYLQEMKKYIKKHHLIPSNAPITLAVDKDLGSALLWEGNHRITCIHEMKDDEFPEFVKVQFVAINLSQSTNYLGYLPKLPSVPKP